MALPIAKVEKAQYDEWAGEVTLEGFNDGKYGRSYIGEIEGEKTWFNAGKRLKIQLEKGNVYSIKMSRKVGTKGWYVNEATLVSGEAAPTPATTKAAPKAGPIINGNPAPVKEGKPEINGQAKGNFRTGLMAYICTYYQIKGEFPSIEVIKEYNELIKQGEENFWNPPISAPAGTEGLIA